jgi:gamma-carbonic anhydrase
MTSSASRRAAGALMDDARIGIGAVVLDGAVVKEGAKVGAGALVAPGEVVPAGWLVMVSRPRRSGG